MKKKIKKLVLAKETVRSLQSEDRLKQVVGGETLRLCTQLTCPESADTQC
jgi:hypothetical protein